MSKAGKFREQITLITPPTLVQNSSGGFSPAPAGSLLGSGTFPFVLGGPASGSVTTWGKVEQLAAKEELVNGKLTYKQPYRITIRFTNAVANVDRITWKGISIAINSVSEDARKTEKILFGYAAN